MVVVDNKKEVEHLIDVLTQTKKALENLDALALHQLSDQTIHTASIHQHTDILSVAVIIYTLNKLVTRKERINRKEWTTFVKKFNNELDKAINELTNRDTEEFIRHLEHAKDLVESSSGKAVHTYVPEIMKKAAINKATKVYEHGISLSRTADLLGLTQWEMLDYIGQREVHDSPYTATIDEKKRAAMALAFFT